MDQKKVLILLKTKGEWVDNTSRIVAMKKDKSVYWVMFFDNATWYPYNFFSICVDSNPQHIDCYAIKTKQRIIKTFNDVLLFPKTKTIKVFKGEYHDTYFLNEYEIITDTLSSKKGARGVFEYYKEIATEMAERNGDLFGYLKKEYEEIASAPSDSALGAYLAGSNQKKRLEETLLFPFSFNGSQYQALKNAFTNDVSIVEGPPGTGKTQTILNMLATAISNNMTVAVVSNNNSAISNVKEKLESLGFGSIVAMLGSIDNIDKFFENKPLLTVPKVEKDDTLNSEYNSFVQKKIRMDKNKEKKNKEAEQLIALRKEYERFKEEVPKQEDLSKYVDRITSQTAADAIAVLENKYKKLGFFSRFFFSLKYKLPTKVLKRSEIDQIISFYKHAYYINKIKEIESDLSEIDNDIAYLEKLNLEEKIHNYSLWRFFNVCYSFLDNKSVALEKKNYKRNFREFLDRYPVFLSSTYSLAKCVPSDFSFDLLIVDESSQANIISVLPALAKAKKVVFLGDLKQLPEIDEKEVVENDKELAKRFEVPASYRATDNNILKSVKNVFGDKAPSVLLNEHYRCQLDIINFSSRRFYNGELVCFTKDDGLEEHLKIIKTVPGNHARRNPNGNGQYNEREIAEILNILKGIPSSESVSVITPYRYQATLLQDKVPSNVVVDTIHRFQGRESDVVIFSTVTNSSNDYVLDQKTIKNFVNQEELINVALTRAKHKFILITSDKIYNEGKGCLGDLVRYIKFETKSTTTEGNIKSIFDILYSDYEQARNKYLSEHQSYDVLTETLTKELIQSVLSSDERFVSFELRQHVRLSDILRFDESQFTTEELTYLKHPWTHVDFVIMNKYDKKPIKLIEVDGVSFHEQKKKQSDHDEIKNRAASLGGLDILRLKTNGSEEETLIKTALLETL